MTDEADEPRDGVQFEVDLDAPPHKVWRAISLPGLREAWLPNDALADPEPMAVTPGEEVRYRMREASPPFLESTVTFSIAPNGAGGTSLRILHTLDAARLRPPPTAAANDNRLTLAA